MGEAKRRGSFEQRKADAIAAGRIKEAKISEDIVAKRTINTVSEIPSETIMAIALAMKGEKENVLWT